LVVCAKARFSELNEASRDDKDAGCGEQRIDNGAQSVMATIQAFVGEQPSVGVLNDTADLAQAGAVRLAGLADHGLNAFTQAEPSIVGAAYPASAYSRAMLVQTSMANRSRSGKSRVS